MNTTIQQRIADGLCIIGCGQKPRPGLQTCMTCAKAMSERKKQYAAHRKKLGKCLSCKKPALPQRVRCAEHLAYYAAKADKHRRALGIPVAQRILNKQAEDLAFRKLDENELVAE